MSDAAPETYRSCNSEITVLLTLYAVLFGSHGFLMGQVLLFVVGRNNKPAVPTVCPDKAAVGKVKTI